MSVILVVDDSQLIRRHIVETLHDAGHETIEADNGQGQAFDFTNEIHSVELGIRFDL